jgi:hypothetical protein
MQRAGRPCTDDRILSTKPLWKVITEDDLKQFSDVLQDAVKQLQERMEA